MANPLVLENVWLQQQKFEDAHSLYQRMKAGTGGAPQKASGTLASEIAAVRQDIQKALNSPSLSGSSGAGGDSAVFQRLEALEKENKELRKITDDLRALILNVQASVAGGKPAPAKAAPAPAAKDDDSDDELDDDDLFGGSDDDDEAAAKLKEQRLAEYAAKKAKKPGVIAKSNVILDVKPWDDETDMAEMERRVRSIEMDGLLWGTSSLVEVGYGIKKLRITTVVEDAKVSVEELTEKITDDNEDLCQSVDIAAFNKI